MSRIIVQIYEIQTKAEAEKMLALGVDHIGSVLVSESEWKKPEIRETVSFVTDAGAVSSLIPLFRTPDAVFRTLEYYRPHIVHFCDSLTEGKKISDKCAELISLHREVKKKFPDIRIMRSIPIARPGMGHQIPSLELAKMFESVSDLFLTDTMILPDRNSDAAEQPVSGFVGITGKTCDWEIASQLVRISRIPVILAGGLGPENVAEGIIRTSPAGVDSCTGTNAADEKGRPIRFRKDPERVRHFAEAVRKTEKENFS
ncbi:MAG: hypothetical protein AB7S75_05500 [Desulfococcaceae bacterium]